MPEPLLPGASTTDDLGNLLAAVIDTAMDAILVCDETQRVVLFNRAAETLFGVAAGDILGAHLSRLLPPAARSDHERQVTAFGETGATRRRMGALARVAGLHADGSEIPLETSISSIAIGKRRYNTAILRDLRETIAAERQREVAAERLRESEARLRAFVDNSLAVVWIKDLEGRYRVVSPYSLKALGLPPEQMIGRTAAEVFSPEIAAPLTLHDRQVLESGEPLIAEEVVLANGIARTFLVVKFPLRDAAGSTFGVGAICTDISDRKEAARALETERSRLRTLLDTLPLLVWVKDPDGKFVGCNPAFERFAGLTERELVGKSVDDLLDRETADRIHANDLRALAASGPTTNEEWVTYRNDGRRALHEVTKTPLRDGDGRVTGILAIARDVTEERRVAEALRESEAAIRQFVAGSPAVIYALRVGEASLALAWVSENLEALTGWRGEEAQVPRWWEENIHPEDLGFVREASALPYEHDHQVLEFRFRKKDGSYFWVRDEKKLQRDAEGRPAEIIGSWTDVTGRRELEEQLRVAHKLEAIGRLAGGIAHDFNNLLTVISGNGEMLAAGSLGPAERILVSELRDASERAASLTRQLLAFSRSQVLEPRVLELDDAVLRIEAMLRRLIGEDIELRCELGAGAGCVRADPGQLEQVIVNLAVNARDAMPNGGRLTLSTAAVTATSHEMGGVPPGSYWRLSVTDTGTGMTPEVRARAFEPFFTTKGPGMGTGLGLATVFGIVEQSAGHIRVASEPGAGTTFEILLPAVDAATRDPAARRAAASPANGRETVLLVEDEPGVRRVARLALERNGYRVLGAEDGRAATAVAESHGGRIDLLLTDVVLPGISGREVAEILRARRPDLKVLFISGYAENAGLPHDRPIDLEPLLQKPFSLADLAAKVREVLDRDAAPPHG